MSLRRFAFALIAFALPAATCLAVTTPVSASRPGEQSIAEILGSAYGGTFVPNGSDDLSNGVGVAAVRIDDDSDRVWTNNFTATKAVARFAGFSQTFGYVDGADGGSFHKLFDVIGSGTGVAGDSTDLPVDSVFRFARAGDGGTWTSNPADNSPGLFDHMITYQIFGVDDDLARFILFFEDLALGDADYNDLAVEVTGPVQFVAIPEPASCMLGFMGLAGLTVVVRRRHR